MKTSKGNEYHKEKSGKIDKIIIDDKVGCITVNNSFEVLKRDTQTVQDNYEHSQKALESLKIDYENLQKELNDIKEKNKNDKKRERISKKQNPIKEINNVLDIQETKNDDEEWT